MQDAPFIGALIIAPYCFQGCEDCQNKHLIDNHEDYIQRDTAQDIINEVVDNELNEGIILGGLEWTYSYLGMKALVKCALRNNLKVFIYTYLDEESFTKKFGELLEDIKGKLYIKFGKYDKKQKIKGKKQFGVKLPTSNQYIKLYEG